MKKRIVAALAASFAVVTLASTAAAAISITQAPAGPGYQNLSPHNCQGRTFYLTPHQGTDQNGNPITVPGSGLPIRLGFGWFTNNMGGLKQFFQNTHGSVSITGDDTFNDSWANSKNGSPFVTQQGITWTVEDGVGTPPGGTKVTGKATAYRGVLSLAPGTYTVSLSMVFDQSVNDGWDTYGAGTNLTSTCTFRVEA